MESAFFCTLLSEDGELKEKLAAGTIGGLVMSIAGIVFFLPIFPLKKMKKEG